MACDIVLQINGELREGQNKEGLPSRIVLKDSQIISSQGLATLDNIVLELLQTKNQEQYSQLIERIQNLKYNDNIAVNAQEIMKRGVVGNRKYHTLQYKYASEGVQFPPLKNPYDPDILLVNRLSTNGLDSRDIVYANGQGGYVYVVYDNVDSIKKLVNHLKTRDNILSNFTSDYQLKQLLPELAKVGKKFNSEKDVLLDFIVNNSSYRDILTDKGLYGILDGIIRKLNDPNAQVYENELDNTFQSISRPMKGGKFLRKISKEEFIQIVKDYTPNLLEQYSDQLQNIKNLTDEDFQDIFEKFSEYLVDFKVKLDKVTSTHLNLKTIFRSIQNIYDYSYSEVRKSFKLEDSYRGYNIYSYNTNSGTKYLYTKDIVNPYTELKNFKSINDIKQLIDQKYESTDPNKNINFSQFDPSLQFISSNERVSSIKARKFYAPGSIIRVLNIELDGKTLINEREQAIITGNNTLQDFYDMFRSQLTDDQFLRLQEEIRDIDSAGIFVHLVNERISNDISKRNFTQDSSQFDQILQEIKTAKENNNYKLYFIQDVQKRSSGQYYTKLISINNETDVDVDNNYKRATPIVGLINETVEEFQKKFGVDAEVLNQEQINEMSDIPANVKAFIREGKIYINGSTATSEDVIHEYTHLFLGALKAKNFKAYEALLNKVMSSSWEWVQRKKNKLRELYPNLADSDLNEEVFVSLFAEHLSGKNPSDILNEVESAVENQVFKSIFNATPEDFKTGFYKGSVKSVFGKFAITIGKESNGLDFNSGTVYRRASNWISEQIGKYNESEGKEGIKENCK